MKMLKSSIIALLMLAFSPAAQACSVCFGDPNSLLSKGAVAGVGVLLLVVMGVLGGVAAFFYYVAKRTASLAAQNQPELSAATGERV